MGMDWCDAAIYLLNRFQSGDFLKAVSISAFSRQLISKSPRQQLDARQMLVHHTHYTHHRAVNPNKIVFFRHRV